MGTFFSRDGKKLAQIPSISFSWPQIPFSLIAARFFVEQTAILALVAEYTTTNTKVVLFKV